MVLNSCVCPGHELRLECTVVEGAEVTVTVWRGSAFECPTNEIHLELFHFKDGISGDCNNGRIIGRSINTTSDRDGIQYISQLIIHLDVNDTLEGRTVECLHDNFTQEVLVGAYTISYKRGTLILYGVT